VQGQSWCFNSPPRVLSALPMGNLHEVSRKVAAWLRQPKPALMKKLA
jgi:hypothetical protein